MSAPRRPQSGRPGRPAPRRSNQPQPAVRNGRVVPTRTTANATTSAQSIAVDRRRSGRRLVGVNVVGVGLVVLMVGRSTQLQVVQRDSLVARGDRQRVRETPIRAERGDILDRFGAPLAMSIRDWRLVADPSLIANPSATAQLIVSALPAGSVDPTWLTSKLSETGHYAILANGIDDDLRAKIEATKVKGVYFEERFRRENPAGDLARSIVGRVDTDHHGTSGLEKALDATLTGRDGVLVSERGENGVQIPGGKRTLQPAVGGRNYVTTIDRSLQYAVDGMNARAIADSGANAGIVAVADPRTGEVLALSNMEVTEDGEVRSTGRNTALVAVYEPGSVNKVITMAAAIEERRVDEQTPIIVPDRYQVGDHKFKDDVDHKTMRWTIRDVLVNSSNVGTIKVAKMLDKTQLDRYLRGFGLGAKTAINFPGESGGILLPTNRWTSTSIGTVPIGQGISVTALQMLSVYNTLANGGVRMPMRLLRSTVDDRGREQAVSIKERPLTVVSKKTSDEVTSMLVDVVQKGTGRGAAVKGYTVAGKTGTAQKPNLGKRGYKEGAYVASFAGYFPAESPRLSIIVVLDEPKTSIYGGVVAAPLFAEVARWAGQHYRIPPSAGSKVVLSADTSSVVSAEMRAVASSGTWQAATIRRNALPTKSALSRTAANTGAASVALPATQPAAVIGASGNGAGALVAPQVNGNAGASANPTVAPATAPVTVATTKARRVPDLRSTQPPRTVAPTTPPTPAPTAPPTTRKPVATVPDLSQQPESAPRALATAVPTTQPAPLVVPVAAAAVQSVDEPAA